MSKQIWIVALAAFAQSACFSSSSGKGAADSGATAGSSGSGSTGGNSSGGSSGSGGTAGGGNVCQLADGGLGLRCSAACLDVESDPSHCGGCTHACAQGQLCLSAQCALTDCAGAAAGSPCGIAGGVLGACCGNGCADLSNDAMNCGACAQSCSIGQSCSAGACRYTDCKATGAAGQSCLFADGGLGSCCSGACLGDVAFAGDSSNCGYCGHLCNTGQVCTQGQCAFLACGSGDDNQSCALLDGGFGACCAAVCQGGSAFDSDPANCGSCGAACASDQLCAGGKCLYTACDGGQAEGRACTGAGASGLCCGGSCSDVGSDSQNCGSCAFVCPSKRTCQSGNCQLPTGGFDAGVPFFGFLDGGGSTTVTVPSGVSSVTLKVWGAGGGGQIQNGTAMGGGGGYASQTFSVSPGQSLTIQVGGAGGNCGPDDSTDVPGGAGWAAGGDSPGTGWHGGGGGGASAVSSGSTLLLVAGGGGGAGGAIGYAAGGAGGSADGLAGGTCGTPTSQSAGAGGLSGDHGGKGGAGYPGSGLSGSDGSSDPGNGGVGGVCSSGDGLGGGGGGGYVGGGGGGGGGGCLGGGAGGGGSNYLNAAVAVGQAVSLAGSGADPANAGDPDLPPGTAEGGGGGLPPGDGAVVVIWN